MPCAIKTEIHTLRWSQEDRAGLIEANGRGSLRRKVSLELRPVAAAQEFLGEQFWGWLVTDRGSASTWYPTWRRQLCWAQLLRDIEAMIQRGGRSAEIGEAFQAQARQMFRWRHHHLVGGFFIPGPVEN
jgi:hypothetical protein